MGRYVYVWRTQKNPKKTQRETGEKLTDQTQPNRILKLHNRKNRQPNPQPWLRVQRQPKESLIGEILRRVTGAVLGFKHPMRIARRRVDFVPPPQADQAAAGDILEVVEVDGEEQDCEDED